MPKPTLSRYHNRSCHSHMLSCLVGIAQTIITMSLSTVTYASPTHEVQYLRFIYVVTHALFPLVLRFVSPVNVPPWDGANLIRVRVTVRYAVQKKNPGIIFEQMVLTNQRDRGGSHSI
eukprot:997287-Amphidinium_carterae.4